MWQYFHFLQQIKKLQLLTQSAALNRETIAASQLATSTGGNGGSQATSSATAADSSTTLTAQRTKGSSRADGIGDTGSAASKLLAKGGAGGGGSNGDGGAASILTVDEDTLSLDRLNSLRIYMTSVKTLPFNLRIYG